MKKSLVKVLAAVLVAVSLAPQAVIAAPISNKLQVSAQDTVSQKRNKVVSTARKYKGVPYVWGGCSPSGFDCSGLVKYVYKEALGIDLPHSTGSLINKGTSVSRANLKPGDIVFPSSGHVGIYTGNGKFIHAPHENEKVKEVNLYDFYAARRIIK